MLPDTIIIEDRSQLIYQNAVPAYGYCETGLE